MVYIYITKIKQIINTTNNKLFCFNDVNLYYYYNNKITIIIIIHLSN